MAKRWMFGGGILRSYSYIAPANIFRTPFISVFYTTYDDLYCACIWLEKSLERLFCIVEFEAVSNQLLRIDEFATQQVGSI